MNEELPICQTQPEGKWGATRVSRQVRRPCLERFGNPFDERRPAAPRPFGFVGGWPQGMEAWRRIGRKQSEMQASQHHGANPSKVEMYLYIL